MITRLPERSSTWSLSNGPDTQESESVEGFLVRRRFTRPVRRDLVLEDLLDHQFKISAAVALDERASAIDNEFLQATLNQRRQLETPAQLVDNLITLQRVDHPSCILLDVEKAPSRPAFTDLGVTATIDRLGASVDPDFPGSTMRSSGDNRAGSGLGRMAGRMALTLLLLLVIVGPLRLSGYMERLFFHPAAETTPVPAELPLAEKVAFASADGTRLVGWFIPAAVPVGHPAPSVVHVHGNAGSINSHWWFTEYLPPAGFNVFIFDYRGYGESAGRATRRGPLIDDSEAALDYLLTRPDVDPQRIALYGQSLGGAIGMALVARRPEIRAAVLESPFISWRLIAANAVGGDPPGALARFLASVLISDRDRPINALAESRCPTLVLHGTADQVIPISHVQAIAKLRLDHVEVIELKGGEHNTLRSTHPTIEQSVIEFLQRELTSSPDRQEGGE